MDFAVPVDHGLKIKKRKERQILEPCWRKLRNLWNMRGTEIPVAIVALGTFSKGFEKELEELEIRGRIEITQTTTLLTLASLPSRVLETGGDLLSVRL